LVAVKSNGLGTLMVQVCFSVAFLCCLTGCRSSNGSPPTDVKLAADTDSTVKLTWTAPSTGAPSKYEVSFRAVDESAYAVVATVYSPEATHDPVGKTGTYKVAVVSGSTRYEAPDSISTVPVATSPITLYELSANDSSGYGWNRDSGFGRTYSMARVASVDSVDFFTSDWQSGANGDT